MVTMRMVKTSQMSNREVLVGRDGPGIQSVQGMTKAEHDHPENC